jgi:hypothetical protein
MKIIVKFFFCGKLKSEVWKFCVQLKSLQNRKKTKSMMFKKHKAVTFNQRLML